MMMMYDPYGDVINTHRPNVFGTRNDGREKSTSEKEELEEENKVFGKRRGQDVDPKIEGNIPYGD